MRPGSSPGCARPGCWCGLRFSETDPGQVTGYAVTLPGHTGPDGAPLWYGGGRLRRRAHPAPAAGPLEPAPEQVLRSVPGAFRFTAPERDAIYQHAARQAAAAAEHIRRCASQRSGRSGRRRLGGGGHAACRGAGAAQPGPAVRRRRLRPRRPRAYGRIPRRTRDGDQLRRTARLIALTGHAHRRPAR